MIDRILAGLVFALAPALAVATAAAAATTPLQPMDIFDLETATDPQISPDGRHVVYVRRFADVMTDRRLANVWIVDADGSNHRPLTTGKQIDGSPRWSPDGSQLLFLSERDGKTQIYRRFMDTGETARLTNLTESPAGIAWSPDGSWISFAMLVPQPARKIADMPAPPEGAKWSEPARVIDRSVYRFNGVGYLEPGFTHLFVVPAEGGTPRQITSGEYHHGGPAGVSLDEAVWSRDGRHLIVAAVRRPDWEEERLDTELWEFSVADGAARALTARRGPDSAPAVSPDGGQIAYVGFDDRFQGYQVRRLYVMNRDGGSARVVTGDFDRDVNAPRWSPDGAAIWFLADERGNTGIWRADLRGKVERVAGNVGSSTSAYGGGGAFTIASDGAFAMTYARPDVPGDVAVGRAGAGDASPKVLTAVNADLFASRVLGSVEEIAYASSKDGREIQGWILKPPDFDAAKRYPLVLEIHGGPFANYGDRFDLEKQLMAARGYSFALTADIGGFTTKYWFPGLPWDHVEHYETRSLLSVVKNVKTPTMVLTGEADYRTPMSESEQYYKALKLLGVEAVLVRVPDEPHGISVHPSHHLAKVLNIVGWFDQHRSGGGESPSSTAGGG